MAWTAGVFDLLSTFAVLVAVRIWQRGQWPGRLVVGVALATAVALASKETAIVLPMLLLAVGGAVGFAAIQCRALLTSAAVVGLYLVGRLVSSPAVGQHARDLPGSRRAWKDLLVKPYSAIVLPVRSDEGLGADAYVLGLCVLVLCGIPLARWLWRPGSAHATRALVLSAAGLAWVLLSALPLLQTFHVAPSLEGSRYLYLPSAGLALALSAAMLSAHGRGAIFASLPVLVVLLLYSRGLLAERAAWQAAATARDALVTEVGRETRGRGCSSIAVEGAPDTMSGVYVFRNDLDLALARFVVPSSGLDCVLRWDALGRKATLVPSGP